MGPYLNQCILKPKILTISCFKCLNSNSDYNCFWQGIIQWSEKGNLSLFRNVPSEEIVLMTFSFQLTKSRWQWECLRSQAVYSLSSATIINRHVMLASLRSNTTSGPVTMQLVYIRRYVPQWLCVAVSSPLSNI